MIALPMPCLSGRATAQCPCPVMPGLPRRQAPPVLDEKVIWKSLDQRKETFQPTWLNPTSSIYTWSNDQGLLTNAPNMEPIILIIGKSRKEIQITNLEILLGISATRIGLIPVILVELRISEISSDISDNLAFFTSNDYNSCLILKWSQHFVATLVRATKHFFL